MKPRIVSATTLAAALLAAATPADAQSDILLRLRSGTPASDRARFDSAGGVVAMGQLGIGILPASGGGYRMMWHPYKAAFRAGSTYDGGAGSYWDESNIGYYSWAGGNRTTASGNNSVAFGEQTTASGAYGVAAGNASVCSGSACVALGHTVRAGGTGSVALGYLVTANNDYSTALGYRASNNGRTGTFVWGDQSAADSVLNQANNEFRIRAAGGVRLRTSAAANSVLGTNSNTGCDMAAGTGAWSCSSSRTIKEAFAAVDPEDILRRLRETPVSTWSYIAEKRRARHLGPVAEDFRAAFGLGSDDTSIGLADIDGVNFVAAQALEARTAALQQRLDESAARVEALEAELAATRSRLLELAARLSRLEAEPR